MVRVCHNLCYKQKVEFIRRPIYLYNRRCSVCDVYYSKEIMICGCCKCKTRGRPHNSKNKQKYINNETPITSCEKIYKHFTPLPEQ